MDTDIDLHFLRCLHRLFIFFSILLTMKQSRQCQIYVFTCHFFYNYFVSIVDGHYASYMSFPAEQSRLFYQTNSFLNSSLVTKSTTSLNKEFWFTSKQYDNDNLKFLRFTMKPFFFFQTRGIM